MTTKCARCRTTLAQGALACPQCGARQIATGDPNDQYGMLDLGGSDLERGPTLETDDAPQRSRPRAASTTGARRAPATSRSSGTMQAADPSRSATGMRAARAAEPSPRASTAGTAPAKQNPASRSLTQSGDRKPTSRSSGAMAAVDLGRTGTQMRAPRTSATSRSGTMRAVQPGSGAGAAAMPDPAIAYGRGMMLDDNPFNAAFGGGGGHEAPALELAHDEVASAPDDDAPPPPPPPPAEPPEQVRARAIDQIAGYGPRPRSPLQQPLYWFHVMNRKRVLGEELTALSAQRKRADGQAQETLVSLAETLLALRDSPELAALGKQFAAVEDAEDRVGHAAAEGQKRRDDSARELARLQRDFTRAEAKAAPLKEREAAIVVRVEELKNQARRADVLRRKADADLEALQRSKGGADPERWAAMSAERDARLGEVQTLGVQLRPLEDDLSEVRRALAAQMRAIAAIQEERRAAAASLERVQQNHRVSEGSARGARLQALLSLANAALKLGLHELVPDYAGAVSDAAERAEKKRQQEELHRAALNSYDHTAYSRGFAMLLGSTVMVFLSLAIAILF